MRRGRQSFTVLARDGGAVTEGDRPYLRLVYYLGFGQNCEELAEEEVGGSTGGGFPDEGEGVASKGPEKSGEEAAIGEWREGNSREWSS